MITFEKGSDHLEEDTEVQKIQIIAQGPPILMSETFLCIAQKKFYNVYQKIFKW